MVLCIEVSEKTKEELDELLRVGHYKDYSQAISLALANQLVIQRQVSNRGEVVLSNEDTVSNDDLQSTEPTAAAAPDESHLAVANQLTHWAAPKLPFVFGLPFKGERNGERHLNFVPPPDDVFSAGQEISVDRWIFGQHNKLLPAKASCRALAHLQVQWGHEPKGLPLAKVSGEIASYALKLGDYLRALDSRLGTHRDESLSIAFPYSSGDAGDKARLRYAAQFVASMNRQGQLSGLLVDLKFVNRIQSKQPRILLTEAGWNFAKLPNPVLDSDHGDPSSRFSSEEIRFLLRHIIKAVPAEEFAFRTILSALADGENTPERVDHALQNFLPERHDKPFTKGFLSTQRSGVISRMADLGLVERIRDGIKVTYLATEVGAQFLNGTLEAANE